MVVYDEGDKMQVKGRPSQDERENYNARNRNTAQRGVTAKVLYEYLYGIDQGNGKFQKASMEQVADRMSERTLDGRSVSSMTRCNGFYLAGGKTIQAARYLKGTGRTHLPMDKEFSHVKDFELELEDFEDFLDEYPDAHLDYKLMDEFMFKCYMERQEEEPWEDEDAYEEVSSKPRVKSNNTNDPNVEFDELKFKLILGFIVLVLIYLFRKPIINFIASLIPFAVIGGIAYLAWKNRNVEPKAKKSNTTKKTKAKSKTKARGKTKKSSKNNSGFGFYLTPGSIAGFVIMMYWGLSLIDMGMLGGDETIFVVLILLGGVACIYRKK